MICREKEGSQAALSEDVSYCAVTYLQNTFLGESFSDLPRTEMGMLEFVSDYFVLIFSRKSSGMRMDSMGLVFQALDISATFSQSLKVTVYPAEWNALFFADFLGLSLAFQDGTDQLISFDCIHSVASRICL